MNILEDLKWRGLLADCTDFDSLKKRLTEGPITLYCGFDPTGDSLHVGHLMGQLMLRRFQLAGHHPIALAGGATGMIGDPSGRSSERNLLTPEQLAHNVSSIKKQLEKLLDFETPSNPAKLVDNAEWTTPITFLDFLRDVGKFFPLGAMLAKDSVKSRMEAETGISYTEFSYQLLQAHDFHHLRENLNCELQIGGSDQWGNITAGIEFIRRKSGSSAWGWTFPLITKSDGTKFGKSEGSAVWLDPKQTSPYRFYQFFINTEDDLVISHLKKFTFLPKAEIEQLAEAHDTNPGAREAHRKLAREVTTIVHGETAMLDAVAASEVLFGGNVDEISESSFNEIASEIPNHTISRNSLTGDGSPLVDLLVDSGLSQSKGFARKEIPQGGIYLNNIRETDIRRQLTISDLLFNKYILLRKGRRNYLVLKISD